MICPRRHLASIFAKATMDKSAGRPATVLLLGMGSVFFIRNELNKKPLHK
jgi:hypothetical protein